MREVFHVIHLSSIQNKITSAATYKVYSWDIATFQTSFSIFIVCCIRMNRWAAIPSARTNFLPGEFQLTSLESVRLDDGDKKTQFSNGELCLTSHRIIWSNPSILSSDLVLPLHLVVLVEEEQGSFMQSDKLILTLDTAPPGSVSPSGSYSGSNYVRLALKQGGMRSLKGKLNEAISQKQWNVVIPPRNIVRPAKAGQKPLRTGIQGIKKSMEQKHKQTDNQISKAFEDIDQLVAMAKPMVKLAKTISEKIRDKQGDVTDDETVKFKSYLMSLGISDPVTRDGAGSDQTYYLELAKEIYQILQAPLNESGGIMTLTDAFCRINRARGMELISPEDLLNACKTFNNPKSNSLNIPIQLHTFPETGVHVLQLASAEVSSEQTLAHTEGLVSEKTETGLSVEEFARLAGIAVVLAKERLLAAETCGRLCRDDSVEGLRFFPNLLLTSS